MKVKLSPEDRQAIVADVKANGPHVKVLAARFKVSPALVASVIRNARDFGLLPTRTPAPAPVPAAMQRAAAEAAARGWKVPAIAAIVGVSDVTVYNWARKYGQPTPGRSGSPRVNMVGHACPNCRSSLGEDGLRTYLDTLAGIYARQAGATPEGEP